MVIQRISKEKEAVESMLEMISLNPEMMDIVGYREIQAGGHGYILETDNGDILLGLAEITVEQYASPVSNHTHISGHHGNLIQIGSREKTWEIDPDRLDTTIQRQIASAIKKNDHNADYMAQWLLIFSTTAFPQIENCVRGMSKVSTALIIARDYLKSLEHVIFDQIWYTNLMTRPVQVWPYSLGQVLC